MRTALLALLLPALLTAQAALFPLRIDQLTAPLQMLSASDRRIVDDALALIRDGRHRDAFSRLSELTKTHPENSSLHIIAAYALLQAGNFVSALEEATRAHEAPNGNSYKCAFRAKVALLKGDTVTCQQELDHIKKAGDQPAEVKQIEKDLKTARTAPGGAKR